MKRVAFRIALEPARKVWQTVRAPLCIGLGISLCHASSAWADDLDRAAAHGSTPAVQPVAVDTPSGNAGSGWAVTSVNTNSDRRVSIARGAFDLGLRFDQLPGERAARDAVPLASGPVAAPLPAVEFGLRSTTTKPRSTLRELSGTDGWASTSERRVAVQWKPASQLLFFRQGVGVRLSGDDRLTMRMRRGVIGLYMKQDF